MSVEMWMSALMSLVGAAIGASAAIVAAWVPMRQQARRADRESEQEAVEQLIARATAVVLRSQQVAVVAPAIGSLNGSVGRLLGIVTPVDLMTFSEPLVAEAIQLEHAAARVRLLSDAATRASAEELVTAAMGVVAAHSSSSGGAARRFILLTLGKRASDAAAIEHATNELGGRRREFERHIRER